MKHWHHSFPFSMTSGFFPICCHASDPCMFKIHRNKENRQTKNASDCNLFNWPAKPMICRCHFLINDKQSNLIAAQFILITAHCCWLYAGKAGVSVGIYPRVIFFVFNCVEIIIRRLLLLSFLSAWVKLSCFSFLCLFLFLFLSYINRNRNLNFIIGVG